MCWYLDSGSPVALVFFIIVLVCITAVASFVIYQKTRHRFSSTVRYQRNFDDADSTSMITDAEWYIMKNSFNVPFSTNTSQNTSLCEQQTPSDSNFEGYLFITIHGTTQLNQTFEQFDKLKTREALFWGLTFKFKCIFYWQDCRYLTGKLELLYSPSCCAKPFSSTYIVSEWWPSLLPIHHHCIKKNLSFNAPTWKAIQYGLKQHEDE